MTQATATKTASGLGKHERLVSFENSNSWLKRFDDQGALVIQAGYRPNPSSNAYTDDENPIVVSNGQARWFGELACQGQHIRSFELSKIETARQHFAALLRPSDDGKDLTVVAGHWDKGDFPVLESALKGAYNIVRNGREIRCTVVKVVTVLEGLGSYHVVKGQLKPGNTMLIELGFGTAEEFLIDSRGRVIDGRAVSKLGILQLVNAIADDPLIRSTLGSNNSTSINLSLLSAALGQPSLGRINAEQWLAIKSKYAMDYLRSFRGYVVSQYENESQNIVNTVLTGGGASLLYAIQPKVAQAFTIPQSPQTASVRGQYQYQLAQLGG